MGKDDKKKDEKVETVPYSKLYCLASGRDKCNMYMGHLFAAFTGVGMPLFVILMSETMDSFGG